MVRPLPLLLLTLLACTRRGPAIAASDAPRDAVRIPPGCEANQGGEYHHAENPAFRYRGTDDGRTLALSVVRGETAAAPGAGAAASSVDIQLTRTPRGFLGETRAVGFTLSGAMCPVAFPTEVLSCTEAGLTLRAVASTAIDDDCQAPASGAAAVRLEQVLVREPRP